MSKIITLCRLKEDDIKAGMNYNNLISNILLFLEPNIIGMSIYFCYI